MGTEPLAPRPSPENLIRRRMNILERAASKAADHSPNHSPSSPRAPSRSSMEDLEDYTDESSHEDHGRDSPSSSKSIQDAPPSPSGATRRAPSKSYDFEPQMSHKAWYQFDLAVLAALVSPLGRLMTGGDHVKNLLFILMLVFYLHQIIEVPWSLYVRSFPRRRPANQATPEQNISAENALQRLEFFFLFLTLASPLAGGMLLHMVTPYITGAEPASFFSSGLFVLATAIRPWGHFVKRLSNRTTELHDAIHYPPHRDDSDADRHAPQSAAESAFLGNVTAQLDDVNEKMERIEKVIGKLRHRIGDEFDELYDYVEGMEKSVHKHEKKLDKMDAKMSSVEDSVKRLPQSMHFLDSPIPKPFLSFLSYFSSGTSVPVRPVLAPSPSKRRAVRTQSQNSNYTLETIPEEAPVYDGLPPTLPPRTRLVRSPKAPKPFSSTVFELVTYPLTAVWRLLTGY